MRARGICPSCGAAAILDAHYYTFTDSHGHERQSYVILTCSHFYNAAPVGRRPRWERCQGSYRQPLRMVKPRELFRRAADASVPTVPCCTGCSDRIGCESLDPPDTSSGKPITTVRFPCIGCGAPTRYRAERSAWPRSA